MDVVKIQDLNAHKLFFRISNFTIAYDSPLIISVCICIVSHACNGLSVVYIYIYIYIGSLCIYFS